VNLPDIHLQIVHLDGPRKGEIDEFRQSVVVIGRSPSSDVVFPPDLRYVSRRHAEIKREGNRFLLVNHSPNGCTVNGKPADSAYLKSGDVITFAEGGPKVSFLYTVTPGTTQPVARAAISPAPPRPVPEAPRAGRPAAPGPARGAGGPFTLQYGTSIKSMEQAAVRLGTGAGNDFVLNHPRVFDTHAEVYYQGEQVFARDLTGSSQTLLNGRVLSAASPLQANDVLTFAEGGPSLKYLGTGRFVEVIE